MHIIYITCHLSWFRNIRLQNWVYTKLGDVVSAKNAFMFIVNTRYGNTHNDNDYKSSSRRKIAYLFEKWSDWIERQIYPCLNSHQPLSEDLKGIVCAYIKSPEHPYIEHNIYLSWQIKSNRICIHLWKLIQFEKNTRIWDKTNINESHHTNKKKDRN